MPKSLKFPMEGKNLDQFNDYFKRIVQRQTAEYSQLFLETLGMLETLENDSQELENLENFKKSLHDLYILLREDNDSVDLKSHLETKQRKEDNDPYKTYLESVSFTPLDLITKLAIAADRKPPYLKNVFEEYNRYLLRQADLDLNRSFNHIEIEKDGQKYKLSDLLSRDGQNINGREGDNIIVANILTKDPINITKEEADIFIKNIVQNKLDATFSMIFNQAQGLFSKGPIILNQNDHSEKKIKLEILDGKVVKISAAMNFIVLDSLNPEKELNNVLLGSSININNGKIEGGEVSIAAEKNFKSPKLGFFAKFARLVKELYTSFNNQFSGRGRGGVELGTMASLSKKEYVAPNNLAGSIVAPNTPSVSRQDKASPGLSGGSK